MDAIIRNGDISAAGSGDLEKAYGTDAVFLRGEILMKMKRGRFYLEPEMGSALCSGKDYDPEEAEMLLNEALAPVEGLSAEVIEIKGKRIKVRLFYKDSEKECEVVPDEYI